MPWCSECGMEYREGFDTCSDCGAKLVENPAGSESASGEDSDKNPEYDREAFLVSVADSMEADMLESLMKENGVPVLQKFGEAGDYMKVYMGGTNFGVDLYVPSHLLSKAQEILEVYRGTFQETGISEKELEEAAGLAESKEPDEQDETNEPNEPDESEMQEAYAKKRRIRTWIILLLFIPGILWIAIELIILLYQQLTNG